MYYLYLLRCTDNSLYCGQTKDLQRRVKEHNDDDSKSKYTRARRPVKLVYFEKYSALQKVMRREIQIKRWTKAKKEALVKGGSRLLKRL